MRPAIAALAAAVLIAGVGSVQAQEPAGTAQGTGTAAAQPESASGKPSVGIQSPKLTPKLLIDTLNMLTRPRPRAPADMAAPTPAAPAAAPAAVTPAPAVVATPAVVIPRDVNPQPSPAPPRTEAVAEPSRPVRPVAEPAPATPVVQPAEPVSTPPAGPAAVAVSEPAANPAPVPVATAEVATPILGATIWLLLGLLAAAGAAAAVVGWQHARRIARTRAVLALKPRLDLAAGATSLGGLALAGPPVAIRARLDGAP